MSTIKWGTDQEVAGVPTENPRKIPGKRTKRIPRTPKRSNEDIAKAADLEIVRVQAQQEVID